MPVVSDPDWFLCLLQSQGVHSSAVPEGDSSAASSTSADTQGVPKEPSDAPDTVSESSAPLSEAEEIRQRRLRHFAA